MFCVSSALDSWNELKINQSINRVTEMAYRRCGENSLWEGPQPQGYSNYTDCYTPESRRLMAKFYGNKSAEDRQVVFEFREFSAILTLFSSFF